MAIFIVMVRPCSVFDDLIVAVGSFAQSSRFITDNISNARAQGVELATTLRGRASGFDLRGRVGYTFLDSEILAVDGADAAPSPFKVGDPLLNRPRHQWALDASVARSLFDPKHDEGVIGSTLVGQYPWYAE